MLKLHFLNVENGDCTILQHIQNGLSSFGVIDCNRTTRRTSPARDKLIELGAERLSFVCITHPDKDHFSGILDVLTHYRGRIDTFYTFPLASVLTDKERLKTYFKQISQIAARSQDPELTDKHVEFMQILQHAYQEFFVAGNWLEVIGDYNLLGVEGFPDVSFIGIMPPKKARGDIVQTVLNVAPDKIRSLNTNSVSAAILIKYCGRTVLLGGDAINENWESHRRFRKKASVTIQSDVVKLPHHGSKLDNSQETLSDFFATVNQGVSVVSADGRKHPDFEIFPILDKLGSIRYCTNLCNPNDRSVKRIFRDAALGQQLTHYLNVFTDPVSARPQPCKGDITITINGDGKITVESEFSTICGCSDISVLAA